MLKYLFASISIFQTISDFQWIKII